MNTAASSSAASVRVEIDDVQSGALRPRPVPYEGKFIFLRVDDRKAGRALLRRLLPVTASGLPSVDRSQDAWVAVAFTYQGLEALGVPQESLDSSFPWAFREGMAARAELIGDVGESAPAHWEAPFGTGDVHIALSALSSDAACSPGQYHAGPQGGLPAILHRAPQAQPAAAHRAAQRRRGTRLDPMKPSWVMTHTMPVAVPGPV
ncbi:hypothetical protein [Streptomyces sp. NBC_01800]|uniref:hypothetical protein n=1 Tax=Streptomyces sp. NBC_01800 TaxID=2975945 RepID=UPI002DDA8564|nr:hypothetical protein [Streptomyces sp. NBC_01800]